MKFGIVGLGRMGTHLTLHAIERGHEVVGYDVAPDRGRALEGPAFTPAASLDALVDRLPAPRVVLLYVPHGPPTEGAAQTLEDLLAPGDVLADGGNSHWQDSIRRHDELAARGVSFLDVGTSGGLEGARRGACFMVGGDRQAFGVVEPLLRDLAVPGGVLHVGPPGAGHFVKLVHNGIEFGMVQAIAEGLDLLRRWDQPLDLPAIFDNWSHGSVIRGWLVELMARGLREHALGDLSSWVEDTREVRWVVEFALQREAWIPVIAQAELALYRYRDPDSAAAKAVALMRHGFGGHPLHRKPDDRQVG